MSIIFTEKKYLNNLWSALAFCAIAISLESCATVAGDNLRTVCVQSHPQGASVFVDGQRQGSTPTTITLPTYIYGGKAIVVKKEGYQDQTMIVNTKFQPCGLWNLLFWPGFIVDGLTGSTVKIDPMNLNMTTELQPLSSEPNAK